MNALSRVLYWLGLIWLWLLGAAVVLGSLTILFTKGIWEFWKVTSPFNILNWGLTLVLSIPGFLLLGLSEKFKATRPNDGVCLERSPLTKGESDEQPSE